METNRDLVEDTGEPHLLCDPGALDSALSAPRNYFWYQGGDMVDLATCLLFALAKTHHPFIQGNKRTAFVSAVIFLEINGYCLTLADNTYLGKCVEAVVCGSMTESEFKTIIRPYIASKSRTMPFTEEI